jgi:sulfur-carrier protein adenylyltransferase/sulfurtransferase
MAITDYFRKVSSWSPEKIRAFIGKRNPAEYTLIDVRQPGEYEKGHLPGARLFPVGELPDHIGELDPVKTAIVYCAAGVRSRAAAAVLERAGFSEVHSMQGGIRAWQGLVAEGYPEAGLIWFAAACSHAELVALAWLLEEGTRTFYARIAETIVDSDKTGLFRELAAAEEQHKEMLSGLHGEITGQAPQDDLSTILFRQPQEKIMEGGMRLEEALNWAEGKGLKEILELSISLETGAYDRYLALQESITNECARKVFRALAEEEKIHLGRITALFDKYCQ